MPFRILSFDGGGIGGLFSARVLERLAAQFPRLIGDADLLAGTSTGGIIALCLARGGVPADLVRLYSERAGDIFDDSWLDNLRDMGTAVGADYDNRKLKRALQQQLGDARLRTLGKRVLVPTFDLDAIDDEGLRHWKPKFFHNFPGNDSDGDQLAVDVALRTSAAPTYFPAYQGYIDGGVVANNPSMAALATALDPRAGRRQLGEVVILSFSTGTDLRYVRGENLDWGWSQWARPLVAIMISGVMGVAHFQCRQILGDRYQRVDRVFDRPVDLDDVRPATLAYLRQQADAVDLAPTLAWLARNWA